MSFYPVTPPDVTPGLAEGAGPGLPGRAGMVAVRVADLARPSPGARTALVTAGTGKIRAGDVVVWLKPVAVTAAVVRRDGRVQAAGHPAEHARLGVAENRLDALTGIPDVIGQIAAGVTLTGKVQDQPQRIRRRRLLLRQRPFVDQLRTRSLDPEHPIRRCQHHRRVGHPPVACPVGILHDAVDLLLQHVQAGQVERLAKPDLVSLLRLKRPQRRHDLRRDLRFGQADRPRDRRDAGTGAWTKI